MNINMTLVRLLSIVILTLHVIIWKSPMVTWCHWCVCVCVCVCVCEYNAYKYLQVWSWMFVCIHFCIHTCVLFYVCMYAIQFNLQFMFRYVCLGSKCRPVQGHVKRQRTENRFAIMLLFYPSFWHGMISQ